MNRSPDLNTLPASIRQRLELALKLEGQGQQAEADKVGFSALQELARTAPQTCALLMAGQLGHRGMYRRVTEQRVTLVPVNQTLFGITIGVSYQPQTETKSYLEEIGFF